MKLIIPFNSTYSKINQFSDKTTKKERDDRQFCTLHYCLEDDCSASFSKEEDLEHHLISGNHNIPKVLSGYDKVKKSFINKVKKSSNLLSSSAPSCSNVQTVINLEGKIENFPFNSKGWALPIRSKFRFSIKQKRLLFKYFIEGEKSGKS